MPNKVLEYRAVAIGVLDSSEHPVQAISKVMLDIDDWARKTRDRYNCIVKIYVVREFHLKTVKPKYVKQCEITQDDISGRTMCLVCGNKHCINESHKVYKGRVKEGI